MTQHPTPRALQDAYSRRGSITAVAEELGVAFDTARRWLIDADVNLRSRGRPSPGAGTASVDEIIERYGNGESFVAIASTMNVSPNTIRNRLIEAGVALRPRPGWNY